METDSLGGSAVSRTGGNRPIRVEKQLRPTFHIILHLLQLHLTN